ncbi:hypothetical protein L9F63_011049 [Diploptera punctata]|uniref:26S proteasome non-ATPase regulatory subunit 6 n=1 Tax=Diploptera punctata TaxID=6984 RepID=A0AAD8EPV8_DIPPU|nr:hypothetical protein L9F63_011049 [Diploptera punctata]
MIELESEGKTPEYMELADLKFMLSLPEYRDNDTLKQKLMTGIQANDMAPYYSIVCSDFGWELNDDLLLKMQEVNAAKLLDFDRYDTVKSNDDDVNPKLWQGKLEYLCSIGDKEISLKLARDKSQDTSLSVNCRLDAIFTTFRIAYFHGCDLKNMRNAIEKANELIDVSTGVGGDWSARNKLKAYEAVCSLGHRNYSRAAYLFLDAVPTFESYELLDFVSMIKYTVLSCMIALSRCEMNTKFKKNSALTQALHTHNSDIRRFYEYLYDGQYALFFESLAKIEKSMRNDKLLHPHYRHYVREMRLKAYSQLLQAYSSLSLKSMADAFNVSEEYIEKEVSRFAALGRLQCKIDCVARRVIPSGFVSDGRCENNLSASVPEAMYKQGIMYQVTIKHGDILLNRLKKLGRVMDF